MPTPVGELKTFSLILTEPAYFRDLGRWGSHSCGTQKGLPQVIRTIPPHRNPAVKICPLLLFMTL